jgi:hypothetical protein
MSDGLLPSVLPTAQVQVDRELPREARDWGRILDVSELEPGDLLLFRQVEPDRISRAIHDAQLDGGFHNRHAQWTHAAVYLGDDEHVCEANFKVPGFSNGVIMRSIHCYCDGHHAIKARRPRNMSAKQRLRIALGALTNLRTPYSAAQLWQFGKAAYSGKGFWNSAQRGPGIRMSALVCSTLYQDAYNFAFRGNTVRMGSLCTPAHLSASQDFEQNDMPLNWLEIA